MQTTEHVLSGLFAFGATEVEVEVAGPEVPILDAASARWCDVIESWWGSEARSGYDLPVLSVPYPIWIYKERADPVDGTFVLYLPPVEPCSLRLTSIVPLDAAPGSPTYWHTFDFQYSPESYDCYRQQLAYVPTYLTQPRGRQPADTFRFPGELIEMRLGDTSLRDGEVWRVPERQSSAVQVAYGPHGQGPAQHKNLDLLGDIAVLAFERRVRLSGWVVASRHGHKDTAELLRRLLVSILAKSRIESLHRADLVRTITTRRDRERRELERRRPTEERSTEYAELIRCLSD